MYLSSIHNEKNSGPSILELLLNRPDVVGAVLQEMLSLRYFLLNVFAHESQNTISKLQCECECEVTKHVEVEVK